MKLKSKSSSKARLNKFYRKLSSKRIKKGGFSNVVRKKPWKARSTRHSKVVLAPMVIDFYKQTNFEKTNKFIIELQKTIRKSFRTTKHTVRISFRNTKVITAASAIYLFAQTARSVRKYPGLKYSISQAQQVKSKSENHHIVDSVLNRLGFYELLGQKKRSFKEISTVKCWHQANGTLADGSVAARIIQKLTDINIDSSMLYRSSFEAISNAVEHGYDGNIDSGADISDKTWWIFVAILEGNLTLLVSDLGHGIPATLEKTQNDGILKELWSMIGVKASKDSDFIHASTLVKRTQTRQSHRGKGGKDLTSLVDYYPKAKLTIFSKKGVYRYSGKTLIKNQKSYDHKSAIDGTILEWSIPLS